MPEGHVRSGCADAAIHTKPRGPGSPAIETFRAVVCLLLVVLALSGCGITQLRERTVEIGSSVGSIYTSQVLENLHRLAYDREVMPSHFLISKGSVKTLNSVTPGVSIPLGNQVTRTIAAGGVTQIVGSYNGLTLQGQEEWDQSWEIEPTKNPAALRRLHALYLYVLGEFCSNKNDKACAARFDREMEPDAKDPLVVAILGNCRESAGCFRVKGNNGECQPPSASPIRDDAWVCLGKYQGLQERMTFDHEMIISSSAFQGDVLFDLVLYSLKVLGPDPEKPPAAKQKSWKAAPSLGDK